jgi:hypothetical protein
MIAFATWNSNFSTGRKQRETTIIIYKDLHKSQEYIINLREQTFLLCAKHYVLVSVSYSISNQCTSKQAYLNNGSLWDSCYAGDKPPLYSSIQLLPENFLIFNNSAFFTDNTLSCQSTRSSNCDNPYICIPLCFISCCH